ncbi:MAG: DUF4178 domain-containing protein [Bacteroidia bacterium]|nr:DUF4178 domain-containing protein [Bacteroidia bacterium]
MFQRQFECPSCGAPVIQQHAASRSIVCGYCHQTSHILPAGQLAAAGAQHLLVDYGSWLSIGKTVSLAGSEYLILGRIRMNYEDGFWDEWFLRSQDGAEGWLQEDDGSFVFFRQTKVLDHRLLLDEIPVGVRINLGSGIGEVFTTSKSTATVEGGEGELPFRIKPGDPADFIEGLQKGQILSVELLPEDHIVFTGYTISLDQLQIA